MNHIFNQMALLVVLAASGCDGASKAESDTGEDSSSGSGGEGGATTGSGGSIMFDAGFGTGGACGPACSPDLHRILDCHGNVVKSCSGIDGCDPFTGACVNACEAADSNHQSVGCEYYATFMYTDYKEERCFAAFVANTWSTPAHVAVSYDGVALPVQNFARTPHGAGPSLSYEPYETSSGIGSGEVAILFLSGATCPAPSAIPNGVIVKGTGAAKSFRITTDVPVVAYQMNPYGGGSSAVTGASLLLPTSAWDTNYIAMNAYDAPFQPIPGSSSPSLNIVARLDDTHVTMVPIAPVQGGGPIPSGPANQPLGFTLNAGQHAQITQLAALTGSVIDADKPIGLMAGHECYLIPAGVGACDHGEQMIPAVKQLGHEHVGVMHRPRKDEPALWRLVGAVDGTTISWSSDVGGPATLDQGQVVEFVTNVPFVVKSQDSDHPFVLWIHMVGAQYQPNLWNMQGGWGDPDSVISVPTSQYMQRYVFFADPTYPETNLVLVRSKVGGVFHDVTLDCVGTVSGWKPVGDYEWTRVDLMTGDFQNVGACSTGRHEAESDAPFGLWIWGWGSPETKAMTHSVSYGYPAGMNVQPINQIFVPALPR